MKKIKMIIVSLMLCCLVAICFSACNDPNGDNNGKGGNQNGVNEYEEFTTIVSTVIKKYAPQQEQDGVAVAKLAAGISGNGQESIGTVEGLAVDDVFNYLDYEDSKTQSSQYESTMNNMAVGNLIAVLSYVEALHEVSGDDKVYDVPMKLLPEEKDENGIHIKTSGGYAIVKSQGTHRIMYSYVKEGNSETVYKYDINYKSKDDFNATMVSVFMNENIVINGSTFMDMQGNNQMSLYYFYGDTNGRSLLMMGDWINADASNTLACKNGNDASVYLFNDNDILRECFLRVYSDYSRIDLTLARSLTSAEKSFTQARYDKVAKKLCKEYGYEF